MGQAAATASTLTVTDGTTATITTANKLRIRIPAELNMTWDASVTTVTLGGGAAGKVSATLLAYEDSNNTAVLNVTSNFAASDQVTVAGLKFTNFTAASSASSLQLVVAGSGGATAATDDKTITIVAPGIPIAEQSVTTAVSTTSSTDVVMTGMTVTPGAGDYLVAFSTSVKSSAIATIYVSIYVDGVKQAHTERRHYQESSIVGQEVPMMTYAHVSVGAGQAVDIRWRTTAGTATAQARTLNLYSVAAANVSQATATGNTTTTSTTYTLLGSMTLSPAAGTYLGLFSTSTSGTDAGSIIDTSLFVGGAQLAHTERSFTEEESINPDTPYVHAILAKVTVTAGQAVEVRWKGSAGTITAHQRTLTLYKVDPASIFEATATADTTSTSTSDALLAGMTLTPGAGKYLALFSSSFYYAGDNSNRVTYHSLYVNSSKLTHTERQPVHEESLNNTNIPVATNGVVNPGAGQAVEVWWRSSHTNTRTARERTLVLLRESAASATLSSAVNQTFAVGQAAATASTMTVTDDSTPTITAANKLRIRIPAALNMTWDPSVTTVTLGGGAAGKVSASGVTYEPGNKTAVLNVTSNFAASDQLTIAGLKFTNFTTASAVNNLQLVVAGAGGATAATDDKTVAIVGSATLSSASNQSFTVGQASTVASTLTVTEAAAATITSTNKIRIRIPATFNMTWDPTVASVTLGGTASGKVSATPAYEDNDRTVVLDVTANFTASQTLTVAGLNFTSFTALSAADNLELVVGGAGGATTSEDDKTITIAAGAATPTLSSAANQTFTVGQPSTAAITLTVTDASTPTITAANEIRIRIPAALNMTWDPAVTTVTLGGGAAGKVSATLLAYENGDKTAVINVTTNFAANDQVTVSGLKFTNFTAVSAASSLQLVVAGAGGATAATDDKTINIVAVSLLSSAANQTFAVGQASTAASTLTVTDSSTPTITAANEIRIRIPAALNMTWDPAVTTITRGGTASGKVSATLLAYEDGNKTAVINVTTNFAASDQLTIAGLKFTNFTAVSAGNLQLVVAGAGGATAAIDDKTMTIKLGITPQQSINACLAPAVGIAANATVATGSAVGSVTFAHTTPSGNNRLLVVGVSFDNDNLETVTGITYNGIALTKSGSAANSDDARVEIWYLIAPPVTTANVVVTLSATLLSSHGIVAAALPLTDVNQTTPVGTFQSNQSDGDSASLNVTSSSAGDLVLAVYAGEQNSNAGACAQGAGQTEHWDTRGGSSGTTILGCGMTATSGGGTVNFSVTTTQNDHWVMGGVPVKPVTGGPLTSLTLPSWTPQSGELLLVGVSLRDKDIVPSVSGNGLTWTLVADRDNDRGQMGVDLYRASGASPTTGSIVISLPGNTLPAFAVAVRLSGVDTAVNEGIEAVATASGPAGADDRNMKVTVTTLTADAMALAWGGQRGSATLSLTAEETVINQSSADCGSSPDQMRGHLWREMVPTPGPTQLGQNSSLSSAQPWAVIGVSIKPIPPTGPQPPGRFNAFETTTVAGALTGVIRTKLAGNTVSLDIAALNSTRTAIDTAFTGTVRVEVLNASSGAPGADGCNAGWPVIQTLSNPTFAAGNNGRMTVSFTQANSYPNVRIRVSYPTSSPTQIGCSNDNFAIRPSTLANFAVSDSGWQTAGTSRALTSATFGTVTHKAGRPVSVRASAVNATGTTATTNYTGAPTQWLSACAGAACTPNFGTLTLATTFAAGQLATDVASYNDVGSFALQLVDSTYASVDAYDTVGDCTASGSYVCSATINVGRFVPDHFAVSLNTPTFATACGAGGFTYVGQAFNYTTQPQITVTAQDFANNTTTRYNTIGSWFRITFATLTGKAYTAATGTLDTAGITGTDPAIVSTGSGAGTLTFSSGTGLSFSRTTPAAPFDADISLAINVIDADGVSYASNPARFGQASAGNGIAFSSGKPMRFGRLTIRNASGSQLLPLLVAMETQYWNGSAFITHVNDSCTTVTAANIGLGNYTNNLGSGATTPTVAAGAFSQGRKTLLLSSPGAANNGGVDLVVNLGSTTTIDSCRTWGATPTPTGANLSHLRGLWCGASYSKDPTARATFGVYRGAEEVIHIRENY